jgi:hypothetical protein
MEKFSQLSIEKLCHYVYLLKDPFDDKVFYVGKGCGNRVFAHLNDALETESSTDKLDHIRQIIEGDEKPIHLIVRHGMDANTAFEVEGALIDIYGLEDLKNKVNGHSGSTRGMRPWEEIEIEYGAVPVVIDDPVMIVKANHSWDSVNKVVVYHKIREDWWVSKRMTETLQYVLVAHAGIVREVYQLTGWIDNPHRTNKKGTACKKIFNGRVVTEPIMSKYLHKDVSEYFAVPRLQKTYAGIPD